MTNSPPRGLLGKQEPRLRVLPASRVGSLLDDVLDICHLAGLRNDPWQEGALEAVHSVNADGLWAATEFGVLVSRQQGKGNILLPWELAQLYLWPRPDGAPKLIGHTAHENKTAREAFLRCKRTILGSRALRRRLRGGGRETSHGVEGISTGNGNWAIELEGGSRLLFFTRTPGAGVGLSFDSLIIDEAQHTPLVMIEALVPTVSAAPNPQILFTGTSPKEGQDAEYFEGLRDRGRAGGGPRTGWIEHTPVGSEQPDAFETLSLGDIDVWRAGAPGLGLRMPLETMVDAWERLGRTSPESFARQYLSVWPDRAPEHAEAANDVDLEVWAAGVVEDRVARVPGSPVVLAVALGRGGGYSSIGAAQRHESGRILLQHLDTRAQSLWVPGALSEFGRLLGASRPVLDERNCATILPDLRAAGLRPVGMSMSDVAAAFDLFVEHVNAGNVVHPDQGEVLVALRSAVPRVMSRAGNLRTWDQSDPVEPVTSVQAITLALWGLKQIESRPQAAGVAAPLALPADPENPGHDVDLMSVHF